MKLLPNSNSLQYIKKFKLFILLFLALTLPVTIYLTQQVQDSRQRAQVSTSPPVTPTHGIFWQSRDVSLRADDFAITTGGKTFNLSNISSIHVSSDPTDSVNPNYTTLEAIWNENNTEMRLFIYFQIENDMWKVSEIRTYNGLTPGNWVYYSGEGMSNKIGSPFNSQGFVKSSLASSKYQGEIRFTNLQLMPFQRFPGVTPTPDFTKNSIGGRSEDSDGNTLLRDNLQYTMHHEKGNFTVVSAGGWYSFYDLPLGNYKVVAQEQQDQSISHIVCIINSSPPCDVSTYQPGATAKVSLEANTTAVVTFKYTPVPITGTVPSPVCKTVTLTNYAPSFPCSTSGRLGLRMVSYTCSDGYTGRSGTQTSCKTMSEWKEFVSTECTKRKVCTVQPTRVPTVTPTPTTSIRTGAKLSGVVFVDLNRNGIFDANETRLPGVRVSAVKMTSAISNPRVGSTITDSDGNYQFANLDRNTEHRISVSAPAGFRPTTSSIYRVPAGFSIITHAFGFVPVTSIQPTRTVIIDNLTPTPIPSVQLN